VTEVLTAINPSIWTLGVTVFGVIKPNGVTLTKGVAEISVVGVGDFKPTMVGVVVNVSVGVTGVAVGIGVNVFVDVKTGAGVTAGPSKLVVEQANENTTIRRVK
jgi:hypothetical protein